MILIKYNQYPISIPPQCVAPLWQTSNAGKKSDSCFFPSNMRATKCYKYNYNTGDKKNRAEKINGIKNPNILVILLNIKKN